MSFSKPVGITESVDYAAEVERIEVVSMDAKPVNKGDCFIDIAIDCTKLVDSSGPIRPVSNAFFKVLLFFPFFITRNSVGEKESKIRTIAEI